MVSKRKRVIKEIISWVGVFAAGIAAAFLIKTFVIVNANVPTGSMVETIPVNSRIVAFQLSYLFSEPERFDIVVFKYPDDESQLFVKRIIGVPGDTIELSGGSVYVNGEVLTEEYTTSPTNPRKQSSYIVPEGSYFMLGDNRSSSEDSRNWQNTFVKEDKILGKVLFSYYPKIKAIK